MTGPIGDEGFKIADGYLRVYTDYKDAIKGEREFLDRSEDDFDRHHERQQQQAGIAGRRAGRDYGQGFMAGLRRTLRGFLGGLMMTLRPLTTGLLAALGGVAKLAGVGLIAGTVAAAVGGLASAIAGLIPLIAELVEVAVAAAGALLLIPGAIAGLIAVVATAKLGLKGMGDAMKAIASGDAAQLAEAMKKLAPQARLFVREIQRMKPAFDRLRLRIQNTLFANLARTLREIGRQVLPVIMRGLDGIAAVLNGTIRSFMLFLLDAQTRLDLARILNLSASAARNLFAGLRPILQILRDIAVVGLEVLTSITAGFSRVMSGFAEDIARLRASGGLEDIIRDGLEALKLLGGLLGDVLGILRSIARAAGEADGLFAFFDRINRLLQTDQAQESLRRFFDALSEIGAALMPVLLALLQGLIPVAEGIAEIAKAFSPALTVLLLSLGNALALLAGPIAALAPLIGELARGLAPLALILAGLVRAATPGLTAFLSALVDALVSLVPVAPVVGKALGDLLTALAPLVRLLGPVLGVLLTQLATVLSGLAVVLGPVIRLFSQFMGNALRRVLPLLLDLAARLLPLLAIQGEKIAGAFMPLIPILAKLFEVYFAQAVALLPTFIQLFADAIPIIGEVAEIFGQVLLEALEAIAPHLPELIRAMSEFAIAMVQLTLALLPILPPLARFLAAIVQVAIDSGLLQTVVAGLIGFLTIAAEVISRVARGIQIFIGWISGARGATQAFGRAVSGSIGAAMGFFRNLGTTIRNAVGNLGSLLFDAGKRVIQGLINGIKAMFGNLGGVMSTIAQIVRDYWPFSPAKRGPLAGRGDMRFAGQNIVDGLTRGIEDKMAAAAAAASALAGLFVPGGGAGQLALAGASAGGGGTAASGDGRSLAGPYIIQIGDRTLVELVVDTVSGEPEVVAASADEGRRLRNFRNPSRKG